MKKENRSYKKNKSGQGIIEYLLIVVLAVMASLAGLKVAGVNVNNLLEKASGLFGQQEETYLTDSFMNLNSWKSYFGQNCWKAENGILSTTKKSCDSRILNTTDLPDDYQVNMDMAQLVSGDGYGITFRLTKSLGSYAGYSFQVDPGYGNKFIFRRYDEKGVELAKPLAIGNPPAGFDFNAPHKVSVSVKGNTFKAYVDGALVLTATDSTYTSGGVGLRVWDNTQAKFSDFSVTPPK
ncbi:MAG: hypothetical protein FD147_385 [Chloroflexi bacterium]|nr:MAG: hypothetical protein FD147_385 [Chloroflexota bacterium]MBA4376619.1 hypothetical protein [Anaerolinea sp.]